jgi:hypothetical protein
VPGTAVDAVEEQTEHPTRPAGLDGVHVGPKTNSRQLIASHGDV